MGFHHIALATRDAAATHDFYTRVMGFDLVKVVTAPTPQDPKAAAAGEGHEGWAKHFFYDTSAASGASARGGGDHGMIAFWEIHDDQIGEEFHVDVNRAAGTPWWVYHFAFDAPTLEVLHERRDHWRRCGFHVLEVDHEFCVSIYLRDPNGNMMEFCHTVRSFTAEERERAASVLADPSPTFDEDAHPTIWPPIEQDGAEESPTT